MRKIRANEFDLGSEKNQRRRRERISSHLLAIFWYSRHGKRVRFKNSICSITCINGFVKLSAFENQDHSGSNEIYATRLIMVLSKLLIFGHNCVQPVGCKIAVLKLQRCMSISKENKRGIMLFDCKSLFLVTF